MIQNTITVKSFLRYCLAFQHTTPPPTVKRTPLGPGPYEKGSWRYTLSLGNKVMSFTCEVQHPDKVTEISKGIDALGYTLTEEGKGGKSNPETMGPKESSPGSGEEEPQG